MYDYLDKDTNVKDFKNHMFNKSLHMFKYKNLPDTIPFLELEKLLQSNGYAVIAKHNEHLYAFNGSFNGSDVYGNPTHVIVTNPYLKMNKTFELGKDCVLIKNDDMMTGLTNIYEKYGIMLVETDITLLISNFNKRIQTLISSNDDNTRESAEIYLEKVKEGELGVIGESKLFDSLKVVNKSVNGGTSFTEIVELQQYLKATLSNEIGLNANYNMKRERLNVSEVEMNTDNLFPLVDNFFQNRKEGIMKVNELFDLDIEVEFTSIWKLKQEVLQEETDSIEDEENNNVDSNMIKDIYDFLTKPDEKEEEEDEIQGNDSE